VASCIYLFKSSYNHFFFTPQHVWVQIIF